MTIPSSIKPIGPDSQPGPRTKRMTAERCAEIINDIHEGMCRANRKELMEVASYISLRNCELYQYASGVHTQQATDALLSLQKFRHRFNK